MTSSLGKVAAIIVLAMVAVAAVAPAAPMAAVAQETYGPVFTGSLWVSNRVVRPGDTIRVRGSGFTGGAPITLQFDGSTVATYASNAKGIFTGYLTVPRDCVKGLHTVTATGARSRGGTLVLSAVLKVTYRGGNSAATSRPERVVVAGYSFPRKAAGPLVASGLALLGLLGLSAGLLVRYLISRGR